VEKGKKCPSLEEKRNRQLTAPIPKIPFSKDIRKKGENLSHLPPFGLGNGGNKRGRGGEEERTLERNSKRNKEVPE